MTASGLKTKRQEAKAAADAAAAAAADACAICDKVYGEDAEKDESWIACDRCNRWYHGTCVGMTQVLSYWHQSSAAVALSCPVLFVGATRTNSGNPRYSLHSEPHGMSAQPCWCAPLKRYQRNPATCVEDVAVLA